MAKIDHEYSCVWADEFNYLKEHDIKYTFVKIIDGTTVWKFKKLLIYLISCLTFIKTFILNNLVII